MSSLDAETVLRLGGWDARHATVVFVAERDDVAIALIDADSDLNLDDFERWSDGSWHQGFMSGSAPDAGTGMQGRVAYNYGQAAPGSAIIVEYQGQAHTVVTADNGWWAFVARFDPEQPGLLPVRRSATSPIPVALRSPRWRRRVWRWPTATPPIVPPSSPPIFVASRAATERGAQQLLSAGPGERLRVRLPAWMVADGQPPMPASGTVLRNVGVRALASQIRAPSDDDGIRDASETSGISIAHEYEITGIADEIRIFEVGGDPEPVRAITGFQLSLRDARFWVQTERGPDPVAPGTRVTARCRLSLIGEYEWDAFALADVRADWAVHDVMPLGEEPGRDFMLLLSLAPRLS